jgi:hypothetical protein
LEDAFKPLLCKKKKDKRAKLGCRWQWRGDIRCPFSSLLSQGEKNKRKKNNKKKKKNDQPVTKTNKEEHKKNKKKEQQQKKCSEHNQIPCT